MEAVMYDAANDNLSAAFWSRSIRYNRRRKQRFNAIDFAADWALLPPEERDKVLEKLRLENEGKESQDKNFSGHGSSVQDRGADPGTHPSLGAGGPISKETFRDWKAALVKAQGVSLASEMGDTLGKVGWPGCVFWRDSFRADWPFTRFAERMDDIIYYRKEMKNSSFDYVNHAIKENQIGSRHEQRKDKRGS